MEYIEPKPMDNDPKKKRNKIIIASVSGALAATLVVVGYIHLIKNVFIEFDHIELYTYTYRTDEPDGGITITGIDPEAKLPSKLRIPTKLNGKKVVALGDNLFEKTAGLVEVVIPDSIESIGEKCFLDCEDLERFNVPSKLKTIGKEAFDGTKWFEDKDEGAVTIGECIYRYKGEMEPDTAIVASEDSPAAYAHANYFDISKYSFAAAGAFADKENLTYVELPDSFTEVTDSLFSGCVYLEEVVLDQNIIIIGNEAFRDCTKLTNPNILTDYVLSIGDFAFANCDLTGELRFSPLVSEIGEGAFADNESLTKVILPSFLGEIRDYTFSNCTSLVDVEFNAQEFMVYNPENVLLDKIGSTISYIGASAFENTAIEEFRIPFNVSTIKSQAFANCPNLERVYTLENTWGKHQNIWVWNEGQGKYGWEESESTYMGLLSIDEGVFKNSPKFEGLVLDVCDENNNVTHISELDEVTIPVTLSNLGGTNFDSELFAGTSINTLNIGKDFTNVINSTQITDEDERYIYLSELNEDRLEILPPSLCYAQTYNSENPSETLDLTCDKLVEVNFGELVKDGSDQILKTPTVKKINSKAFKGASNLVNFTMGDTVEEMGTNIFEDCAKLKTISLSDSLKVISNKCFYNCVELEAIVIPETVRTIGDDAFNGCSKLASVTYAGEHNVDSIGNYAFKNCISLLSFDAGSCEVVGKGAFEGCISLSSIVFTSSTKVPSIKTDLFKGCSSLNNVVLDENIAVIEKSSFEGCSSLTSITLKYNGVVKVEADSFKDVTLSEVRVPASQVEAYRASEAWALICTNFVAID